MSALAPLYRGVQITKDALREQLAAIGYRDVPEEVLTEFLEELSVQQKENSSPLPISKQSPVSSSYSQGGAFRDMNAISTPYNQDSDSEHEEAPNSDEDVVRMTESDSEVDAPVIRKREIRQRPKSATVRHATIEDMQTPPRSRATRPMSAAVSRTPVSQVSFNVTPYKGAQQQQTQKKRVFIPSLPTSTLMVPPATSRSRLTQREQKAVKADPVSLFHRYNNSWQGSRFLQGAPRKVVDMIATPRASDPEWMQSLQRRRKPAPFERLPTYQVPTEKRRDDLRWDMRARMLSSTPTTRRVVYAYS